MRNGKIIALIVAVAVVGVGAYIGIQHLGGNPGSPLIVYSADAYTMESNYLLNGFHNSTGAPIVTARGGGSFTDAREIGQGNPANAFISVALNSYNKSYLGSRYTGWTVAFASDQLALAYSNATDTAQVNSIVGQFSRALSTNSTAGYAAAYANLTSGKVKVGISDPGSDPAGLRGWISLEIAGSLYASGNQSYYTGRLVSSSGLVNGSSAAALVSPLETGQVQFLFIYKSAAISKGLSYVSLPQQANFGNLDLANYYSSFTYQTQAGLQHGSAILLFVSTLAGEGSLNSTSLGFAGYVINNSMEMQSFGLTPLPSPVLYNNTVPPPMIQGMVSSGKISEGGSF